MPNKIQMSQLQPNKTILVHGKVSFSHITSLIDGNELKLDNQKRSSQGRIIKMSPYYTITLKDVNVELENPNIKTTEDMYVEERFYNSKSGNLCYTFESSSKYLPRVCQRNAEDPTLVEEIVPKAELARDLDVTLVLKTYLNKTYNKTILGLNYIIVNEPIRYYEITANLENRNLKIKLLSEQEKKSQLEQIQNEKNMMTLMENENIPSLDNTEINPIPNNNNYSIPEGGFSYNPQTSYNQPIGNPQMANPMNQPMGNSQIPNQIPNQMNQPTYNQPMGNPQIPNQVNQSMENPQMPNQINQPIGNPQMNPQPANAWVPAEETWVCPICSTVNPASLTSCKTCNQKKPDKTGICFSEDIY